MLFRKKQAEQENLTLEQAYQMVFEDFWNSGLPLYQGRFNPTKRDEEFMQGIMYVMNLMALGGYPEDKEKSKEKMKTFTENMHESFERYEIAPGKTLDDIQKEVLINRLRQTDDKVLNYFADEYENNGTVIKMSNSEHMAEIAAGKKSI